MFRKLVKAINMPYLLAEYFSGETGSDYGLCFGKKLSLAYRMYRNNRRITSGSSYVEHLVMAAKVMRVPKETPGCIVECGCYKGGSTANLSLVAAACGRELVVFDSFKGLPEPKESDRAHVLYDKGKVDTYEAGAYAGSIEEVRRNIAGFGEIGVCSFVKGYFEDTMPGFGRDCVFAFLDVDLRSSIEDCVKGLWPHIADGCCMFTHEADHREIAGLFFDEPWWKEVLSSEPPGLTLGSSSLAPIPGSEMLAVIGYTVKNPLTAGLRVDPQVGAPER